MPAIEIPVPWSSQPTFARELNQNSSLTLQAISAYAMFSGNINLAGAGAKLGGRFVLTGNDSSISTAGGRFGSFQAQLHSPTNYRQVRLVGPPPVGWTVAAVLVPLATPTASGAFVGLVDQAGVATADRQIRAGATAGYQVECFDGAVRVTPQIGTITVGVPNVVVGTCNDQKTLNCYVDGKKSSFVGSGNWGFTAWSNGPYFNIGNACDINAGNFACPLALLIGRAWTDKEANSFCANPWQVLAP